MKKLLLAAVVSLVLFAGCTIEITSNEGKVKFENGMSIAVPGGSLQYDIKNITCDALDISSTETILFGETTGSFSVEEDDSGTYDISALVSLDYGENWSGHTFEDVAISVKADETTVVTLTYNE